MTHRLLFIALSLALLSACTTESADTVTPSSSSTALSSPIQYRVWQYENGRQPVVVTRGVSQGKISLPAPPAKTQYRLEVYDTLQRVGFLDGFNSSGQWDVAASKPQWRALCNATASLAVIPGGVGDSAVLEGTPYGARRTGSKFAFGLIPSGSYILLVPKNGVEARVPVSFDGLSTVVIQL